MNHIQHTPDQNMHTVAATDIWYDNKLLHLKSNEQNSN